jgi:SagB-type dehydrogenase family enzyme
MDIMQKRLRKDPLRLLYEDTIHSQAEIYHELSKITHANGRSFRRRIQSIIGPEFFLKRLSQGYKSYPTSESVPLPKGKEVSETPLGQEFRKMIVNRRSVRQFTGRAVSLNEISVLMRNTYGITGRQTLQYNIEQILRAVPSGGALYPLELYVASFDVEGLEPGVYHYNVQKHSLEHVKSGQFRAELGRAFFYEEMFKKVSAQVIITGVLKRSYLKYGERSYRFMTLEAGHVGQNLVLSAVAMNLGCLMLGGYIDDDVNNVLEIDGVNESTLYGAAIGYTA